MRGKWFLTLLIFSLSLCGCSTPTSGNLHPSSVLIDPGHGGFDGGAVASDGTLEKDINLSISFCLHDMLLVCGVPVNMTRATDVGTHANDAKTIREKKVSDLHNRLALYEQSNLVIAVHQNHFHQSQYSGTQVFYSGNSEESQRVADHVQAAIIANLQPHNHRQTQKATDGIYLMYHTSVPAILIECGFLSNSQELVQLKDTRYRQQMAFSILTGYWNYLTEK